MELHLLEKLLNEDEGPALDFKRSQYPFRGATVEQKSELLKDILAFANAWKRTDGYILIGVEEVRGGRSRVVGVTEHLADSDLQQFVNSKVHQHISFAYEAFSTGEFQIGIIHIPLQPRPAYLTQDFGKLKKNTVYVRRGSSTAVATPDEIARMGATKEDYRSPANLTLLAKIPQWDTIVLTIINEGEGSANAPYLSLELPENYRLSPYGIDGHYSEGILGKPHGKGHVKRLTFGGRSNIVIHPKIAYDVAALKIKGGPENKPTHDVVIEYALVAENFDLVTDRLIIPCQSLADAFDVIQSRTVREAEMSDSIRNSNDLLILSCQYLTGKAHHLIGKLVGVKNCQVGQVHPLPFGYTHFALLDPDSFDGVIKHGDPIEDIVIHRPRGHFFGIIRDDLFNYPYLHVTEYEPIECPANDPRLD